MNIRKNENNNSRNIYREMFVMRPLLKKVLEIYRDAEVEAVVKKRLKMYEDAENRIIIKMYANYFKK